MQAFRQTVARNLAAYRWGRRRIVSSPEILSGEPVFRGTQFHFNMWHRCIERVFPNVRSPKIFRLSVIVISRMPGWLRASERNQDDPKSASRSRGNMGTHSDPSTAGREYLAGIGEQTCRHGRVRSVGTARRFVGAT